MHVWYLSATILGEMAALEHEHLHAWILVDAVTDRPHLISLDRISARGDPSSDTINLPVVQEIGPRLSPRPLWLLPRWPQRWELCLTFALAPAKPCKFPGSRKQLWIP